MFDKLKKINKIRKIQSSLKQEKATSENQGVSVVVNGNLKIEEIKLNPELEKEKQETILKDCLNEAMQKIQAIAAQKMSQMGGMDF